MASQAQSIEWDDPEASSKKATIPEGSNGYGYLPVHHSSATGSAAESYDHLVSGMSAPEATMRQISSLYELYKVLAGLCLLSTSTGPCVAAEVDGDKGEDGVFGTGA